jgi:outer membrane protein assembly factor BamB
MFMRSLRGRRFGIALVFSAMTFGLAALSAQDWPQWRGPSRNGAAPGFTPPATWPERPKQVWKVQVGEGHASPIVAGGRVFVFARAADKEVVSARDAATAKEIWRVAYDAPYTMNSAATSHGKGPKATPLYDRDRLYTFGIGGILSAWQAQDGRLLWRRDFKKDFPSTTPDFGVATSPIVVGDTVVVHAGGTGNGAILALDVASGATKWSWKGDGPAYASPIVADFAGTRQIVTQSQRHVVALAAADGRQLWEIPFATDYEQNSVTPIAAGDLLIYGGLNKPTTAVRPTFAGGKWTPVPVWQNPDVPMYMSSPVEAGGYLFGLTQRNRGQFYCLDVRSGKTMWTSKGREGENASLIIAGTGPGKTSGSLVMSMTTDGVLVVLRGDAKAFDVIKRYTLAESAVWAHPAVVGGGIIVKDVDSLTYWTF